MNLHDIEPENEDILGFLNANYQNLQPFIRSRDGQITYGGPQGHRMHPEEEASYAQDVLRWIEQGRPKIYNRF